MLTLKIKTDNRGSTNIVDTVNDTLRALALSGDIDDHDDAGWEWSGQEEQCTPQQQSPRT